MDEIKPSFYQKTKRLILGKAHNPFDPKIFHSLSLIAIFAWIGLGADALSSSCYGPSEAFMALGGHTYLAIFIAIFTAITIFIISASYSQLIEVFPGGGGGYLVASKLLSPTAGMISGCALLIDYVLTITLSIASGADALFSFIPIEYQEYKLAFALGCIFLLIILNLRGVKESVITMTPIFILFIVTHLFAIVYAIMTHDSAVSVVAVNSVADFHSATLEIGLFGVLLLMLHAYSMGAGTYTGIEAVSNSVNTLREPRVKTAKTTMRYMSISLAILVFGLMLSFLLYEVTAEPGKTLNAVLFEIISADWTFGKYFVLAALISEALLLLIAAQTGFLGGPRVLANMAADKWLPMSFTALSDRLVIKKGILLMGLSSIILMILTKGSVGFLVILYSITVFITFFLSQLAMVKYWIINRTKLVVWRKKLFINAIGLILTTLILISVVILKFKEGGWITLTITSVLIVFVIAIRMHYRSVSNKMKQLNVILPVTESKNAPCFPELCNKRIENKENNLQDSKHKHKNGSIKFDSEAKTAVILVNGYNGIGIEAIQTIFRNFGDTFRNFVFVYVGHIDAGVFKGADEVSNLKDEVELEAAKYVELMKRHGYYAKAVTSVSTDVLGKLAHIAPKIKTMFPNAVFFGGQIILPKDGIFTKMLHNYTVFALEKKLFREGIPFIILPIKV